MGDIGALAANIVDVGLLHPVVVTRDFSAEHVLDSDCPRLEINGRFLFGDADIIALAERLLTEAPVLNPQPYPSAAFSPPQKRNAAKA
jgi:hypothetical protein